MFVIKTKGGYLGGRGTKVRIYANWWDPGVNTYNTAIEASRDNFVGGTIKRVA